jgi:hypothetical protein
MFRRKQNGNQAPRFRRDRRSIAVTEADDGFLSAIEAGIHDIFRLALGLTQALYRLLLFPLTLEHHADSHGKLVSFVPPHTFLTLAVFLASKSLRLLIGGACLGWLANVRGCAPETQLTYQLPTASELVQLPTIEDVLLTGVPTLLLVLLLLFGIANAWAALPRSVRRKAVNLSLYIIGLEFLLVILGVAYIAPNDFFISMVDETRQVAYQKLLDDPPYEKLLVACAIVVTWPTVLLSSQVYKSISHRAASRVARTIFAAVSLGIAFSVCLASLLIGIAVAFVPVRRQIEEHKKPNPHMQVWLLNDRTAQVSKTLTFLVLNRSSSSPLSLFMDKVKLQSRQSGDYTLAKTVAWSNFPAPVMAISPKESGWFVVEMTTEPHHSMSECADDSFAAWNRKGAGTAPYGLIEHKVQKWIFGDLSYPTPTQTKGRLCLVMWDDSGSKLPVRAFF